MKILIVIVDYGMGNLCLVVQVFKKVELVVDVVIVDMLVVICVVDCVVLFGQGVMLDCMCCFGELGLQEVVIEVLCMKLLFGVCVGEQMLFDWSVEGDMKGFGFLFGKVVCFEFDGCVQDDGLCFKVLQMGWNCVCQVQLYLLWDGVFDDVYFYFVYSYYVMLDNLVYMVGEMVYGVLFMFVVVWDNFFVI